MPTEAQLVDAGRHDLRWALRIHDRSRLARDAGLADPNRADPETKTSLKMRLGYDEAREFMRNAVRPRLPLRAYGSGTGPRTANGRGSSRGPAEVLRGARRVGELGGLLLGTPRPPGNPRRVRAFKAYADAKRYMREVRRERRGRIPTPRGGFMRVLRGAAAGHVLRVQALGVLRRSAAGHPRDPVAVYGKRGEWVSWDDFLGRAPGTAKRG